MKTSLSEIELIKIAYINALSRLVYAKLFGGSMLAEFIFYAGFQYLAIVFFDFAQYLHVALMIVSLMLWQKNKKSYIDPIDQVRSVVMGCVAVAIFAADFPFYQSNSEKLGKSMDYGLQLMDIGVGSFVYNAGFFSTKATFQKKIKNIGVSLLFGTLRLISKAVFHMDVRDAEFGKHLNFFYILAILNGFSLFLGKNSSFITGFLMCVVHELLLNFAGLKELVYGTDRSNFILANIEGLCFVLPQMGIFIMASAVAKVMFSNGPKKKIIFYNAASLLAYGISRAYSLSNRRLHNMCFCMTIFILLTTLGIVSTVLNKDAEKRRAGVQRFVSRNLLFVFIWSNLLVFGNKLLCKGGMPSESFGHAISIVYLAAVFYLPAVMFSRPRKRVENIRSAQCDAN